MPRADDPVLDIDVNGGQGADGLTIGLGIAWYVLPAGPDGRALAKDLYDAWVAAVGLDDPVAEVQPQMLAGSNVSKLALLLAQEFGMAELASKIRTVMELQVEPKFFGEMGEFGFFSFLDEVRPFIYYPAKMISNIVLC